MVGWADLVLSPVQRRCSVSDDDYGLGLKVHEDAYRELEEELAKAKSKLEEVGFRACCVLLERDEAREQRDRLAEAATVLIAAKGRHNTMLAYRGLREALAAVKGSQP
jgi:hypothetical protein